MKANSVKFMFKISMLFTFFILVVACQQDNYKESVAIDSVDVSEDYESIHENTNDVIGKPAQEGLPKQMTKIIKSANVRYKVKKVKVATKKIKQIAKQYNAYISDLRFQNDLYMIENRFTVKVPYEYFDIVMDSIGGVAEFVEYENITTKDVTEEYVDIQTRLKTKLEVKQRYESILRKNAKTVEDILATEERLRIIQEEIESAQGRLKYLTSKVAFSTIQIDLYETTDYKEKPVSYNKTFLSKAKNGLSFGWDIIETLVLGLMHIWPLIIIGVIAIVFFKRQRKNRN